MVTHSHGGENMSKTTTRRITLSWETCEKLEEIMKMKGFTKKGISESQIIEEALKLLYKNIKTKKER